MASLDNTSVKPFGGYNKCSVDLLVSIHFPSPLTMLGFPSTLLLKHPSLALPPGLCQTEVICFHKLCVNPASPNQFTYSALQG